MPLLEAFEQRVQERANAEFAFFLEEFERRRDASCFAKLPWWEKVDKWSSAEGKRVKEVEVMLRNAAHPTVCRLRAVAAKMQSTELDILSYELGEVLISIGMSDTGSGGYHRLRTMSTDQLDAIVWRLNQIVPRIHAIYRQFQTDSTAGSVGRGRYFYPPREPLRKYSA